MEAITQYRAIDGSIWNDEATAIGRDELVTCVDAVMLPLGPKWVEKECDHANGGGYIQHNPNTVADVHSELLRLARKSSKRFDEWVTKQVTKYDVNPADIGPDWCGRMLDSDGPLSSGFYRLMCIDKKGREWGQPYYALHPNEGENRCLDDRR